MPRIYEYKTKNHQSRPQGRSEPSTSRDLNNSENYRGACGGYYYDDTAGEKWVKCVGEVIFFASYVVLAILIGHPLLTMQAYVGQFLSKGPIYAFCGISPATKGVGYGIVILNAMLSLCSGTHMSYSLYYLYTVIAEDSPWEICADEWQPDCHCYIRPRKFPPMHQTQCVGEPADCEPKEDEEEDEMIISPSKTPTNTSATKAVVQDVPSALLKRITYRKHRWSKRKRRETRYSVPTNDEGVAVEHMEEMKYVREKSNTSRQHFSSRNIVENPTNLKDWNEKRQTMNTLAKEENAFNDFMENKKEAPHNVIERDSNEIPKSKNVDSSLVEKRPIEQSFFSRNFSFGSKEESVPLERKMPEETATECYEYPLESSTSQYFRKIVLKIRPNSAIWNPQVFHLNLLICFVFSWLLIAAILISGRTVYIVVIYVTTISPIIFFVGLSIRLLWDDLDITFHALQYYFLERMSATFKFPETILYALDMILINMSVGTGAVICISSYNRFHYHFPSNAVTADNLSTLAVLILTCSVIICYGSVCAKSSLHYNEVDDDGMPMFVIILDSLFYISTNTKIWEICITICFFFISINSVIVHVDTMSTSLFEIGSPSRGHPRVVKILLSCIFSCFGMFFLFQGGYRLQFVFCRYLRTNTLMFMALIIHLSIYYIIGYEHVQFDHVFMLKKNLGLITRIQYAFVVPIVLIICLLMNEYRNTKAFYIDEIPFPYYMKITSFCISFLPFIPIFFVACFQRIKVKKREKSNIPYYLITELWGPGRLPDYIRYVDYMDFKDEGITRLRDKATMMLYGVTDPNPVVMVRNSRRWKLKPGQELKIPPSRLSDAPPIQVQSAEQEKTILAKRKE